MHVWQVRTTIAIHSPCIESKRARTLEQKPREQINSATEKEKKRERARERKNFRKRAHEQILETNASEQLAKTNKKLVIKHLLANE